MRAVSRFGKALLAGALAFAPWSALAQQAPAPTTNTPAVDTIGPRELQNFSLKGTVTRPADEPTPVPPKTRAQRAAPPVAVEQAPKEVRSAEAPKPRPTRTASAAPVESAKTPSSATPSPPPSLSALPQTNAPPAATPAAAPTFAPDPASPPTLAPERNFSIFPWLLALLALCVGGAFLFFRNRGREAFAGGPHIDSFVAATPAPAPRPAPVPPAATPEPATPSNTRIISTRIRPWVEIAFHPLRCVLEADKVTVDFEIELSNSGSAPARGVLVEAGLFNAGSDQDQDIGAFFAKPDSGADRIDVIPPMSRMALRTKVSAPLDQVRAYELAGRRVFLPLIAFNALYKWSGGVGQTSASYLLGRDTDGEKMGPFRLDLGPRIFRGVGGRLLPAGIRR